jgi:hypothetical protein
MRIVYPNEEMLVTKDRDEIGKVLVRLIGNRESLIPELTLVLTVLVISLSGGSRADPASIKPNRRLGNLRRS